MSQIQGWFLLVIGIGLVAVAVEGVFRGWLPNGPNGFKRGKGVYREGQPIGFWFFFSLYFGGGFYVLFHALRVLFGHVEPLPLQ